MTAMTQGPGPEHATRAIGASRAIGLGLAVVLTFALSSAACGDPVPLGGFTDGNDAGLPNLTGDASAAEADANAFRPLCAATQCPAPYATCSDDTFRCETNFDSDNDSCGACGVVCPSGEDTRQVFGAEWFCQSGKCKMTCSADLTKHTADCNTDVADGCEVDLNCDPNNCGACGVTCPSNLPCILGNCGCPAGLTSCSGSACGAQCLDLASDDYNCGTCGTECPQGDEPPAPNMHLGCGDSQCGKEKCDYGFGNCNDTANDGCETSLADDPANCGTCGKACLPNQTCSDGACRCTAAETACGDFFGNTYCADLDSSRNDCGACGNRCPFVDFPSKSVCRLGRCEIECASGHADCDGKTDNGCETLVDSDPRNCGGCGVQCDLGLGQPCVHGTCLQAPCDEGTPQ